ncbi:MAG: hypothetical protein IJI53_11975 [Clostridia bacterium]|nr:hypothetical protein [Clostridia bacterium]MBR0408747.1 hypothetical protein [Clostridia bacterium]
MSEEIKFIYKRGTQITPEEIAMIEAASAMPAEYDEDNPEIDPIKTPELYAALVQAVAERNQRISKRQA